MRCERLVVLIRAYLYTLDSPEAGAAVSWLTNRTYTEMLIDEIRATLGPGGDAS